jgi:hypothetical protein
MSTNLQDACTHARGQQTSRALIAIGPCWLRLGGPSVTPTHACRTHARKEKQNKQKNHGGPAVPASRTNSAPAGQGTSGDGAVFWCPGRPGPGDLRQDSSCCVQCRVRCRVRHGRWLPGPRAVCAVMGVAVSESQQRVSCKQPFPDSGRKKVIVEEIEKCKKNLFSSHIY